LAQDHAGRLGEFLHGVEPYISKQLINNLRSRAFEGLFIYQICVISIINIVKQIYFNLVVIFFLPYNIKISQEFL